MKIHLLLIYIIVLISIQDDGTGPQYDLPSPSKAGAVSSPVESPGKSSSLNEDSRWARDRTGWGPRFGQGDPEDDEGPSLLDHQTMLEGKLDDKWFGGRSSEHQHPPII